jgi:regulatory protein YycI of two-component signal transduction system YycFG
MNTPKRGTVRVTARKLPFRLKEDDSVITYMQTCVETINSCTDTKLTSISAQTRGTLGGLLPTI